MTQKAFETKMAKLAGAAEKEIRVAENIAAEARRQEATDAKKKRRYPRTLTKDTAEAALARISAYWKNRREAEETIQAFIGDAFTGARAHSAKAQAVKVWWVVLRKNDKPANDLKKRLVVIAEMATGRTREEAERTTAAIPEERA